MIILSSTCNGAFALSAPDFNVNHYKDAVQQTTPSPEETQPKQRWQSSKKIQAKPATPSYPLLQKNQSVETNQNVYPEKFASTSSSGASIGSPADIPAPVAAPDVQAPVKPAADNESSNDNTELPQIKIKMLSPAGYPSAELTLPERPSDYKNDIQFNKIVINLPSRTLWLFHKDEIVKYFPVGVGRKGFPTPVGQHQVIRKIRNPGWENPYKPAGASRINPGSNNPLGTRWIGFKADPKGEYGMHGTNRPSSVGKFSSHGCVRMRIPDAEELYDLIDYKTPVEVTYEQVLVRDKNNEVLLIPYSDYYGRGRPSFDNIKKKILKKYPTALVDDTKIKYAIAHPTERPYTVGKILPPPVAQANPQQQQTEAQPVIVKTPVSVNQSESGDTTSAVAQ